MKSFAFIASCLAVGFVAAQDAANPCAELSKSYDQQANDPEAAQIAFQPSDVLACLRDVPIDQTLAVAQIEWMQRFIPFQSTLSWLKNPPSTYGLPPTDLVGGLQNIQSKAESGEYTNHFDFEVDIDTVMKSASEGHLNFRPFLIGAFQFVTGVTLVSISDDGEALPKVYFLHVIVNATTFTASDVIEIDGIDVTTRLVNTSQGFQDLDALYNQQLLSNPQLAYNGGQGLWAGLATFDTQNDTTLYKFRNGTSNSLPNLVVPLVNLSGIASGQDIFTTFLTNNNVSDSESSNSTETTPPTSTPTSDPQATAAVMSKLGFPTPVAVAKDNSIGGYFSTNVSDLAILSIRAFTADQGVEGEETDFQDVIQKFLDASKSAGKKRLVIDIRGNPGGAVYTGYDTFKQIFPTHQLNHRIQIRAHTAAQVLSKYVSIDDPLTMDDLNQLMSNTTDAFAEQILAGSTDLNYKGQLQSPDGKPFSSLEQFLGPRMVHGDNFTSFFSHSFSNIASDEKNGGLVVTGYGNRSDLQAPVFAEENVILLSDAACSSTCGVFTNLLLSQTNISTVVIGGRPSNNKMAVVGGTQGAQVSNVGEVQGLAFTAMANMNSTNAVSESDMNLLQSLQEPPPIPFNSPVSGLEFNFEDNMPLDDDTPLQFKNERTGNCRLFFIQSDLFHIGSTWDRIATGPAKCVDGGSMGAHWGKKNISDNDKSSKIHLSAAAWIGIAVAAVFGLCLLGIAIVSRQFILKVISGGRIHGRQVYEKV